MSTTMYRGQLDRKRKQRLDAEKKAGTYRTKESQKRTAAATARLAASKTKNASTFSTKIREAERHDSGAAAAGKEASRWQEKANGYAREELTLLSRLAKAEQGEAEAAERGRKREQHQTERIVLAERSAFERRLDQTDAVVGGLISELRAPQSERLRILILGASSEGDLRVGREAKRIRAAVESALHRDLVELDERPAATTTDLLDGITKFRPHVVHFSGHSSADLIVFEDERDEPHDGVVVTEKAFRAAVKATDDPPLLVVLNSCSSASQIDNLVDDVAPFAIGMAEEIEDADAITYAAQFYAALANGQSIKSAHLSGQAALELAGLTGTELPTLASALHVDPADAYLVKPV